MDGTTINLFLGCELRAQARADAHDIMLAALRTRDDMDEENGHGIDVPAAV